MTLSQQTTRHYIRVYCYYFNSAILSTFSQVLSDLDIAKMECLYYCDGTNPGTCGGHKYGKDDIEIGIKSVRISWV